MGSWGTGITSTDTFQDIYSDFYDLYNKEHDISFICKELEQKYASVISDEDEANEYFFAMAKAKWECGFLDNELLTKIKTIVESGSELQRWKDLGASKSNLAKREKAINIFYTKLQEVNEKPKRPKKIKLRDSIFKKGDCLSINLPNGKYAAAIVVAEEKDSEFGLNLLVILDYYSNKVPQSDDFINGNCLIKKNLRNKNEPYCQYCLAQHFKRSKVKYDVIVNININRGNWSEMHTYGHWDSLAEHLTNIYLEGSNVKEKKQCAEYLKIKK